MALTFIDLTNGLLRRMNEVEITPADFSGVRGVQALAKDAIKASVAHINRQQHKWPFNADTTTQVLTTGTEEYVWPVATLKLPDWDSFYIVGDDALSVNFTRLKYIPREEWIARHREADFQSGTSGRETPRYVFPRHAGGFGVSPSPNNAYTVVFDYWAVQGLISVSTDTVTIPDEYEDIIVDGGKFYLYMYRDNRENAALAEQKFAQGISYMRTLLINKDDYATDMRVGF